MFPKIKQGKRWVKRFASRAVSRGSVLLYHRIATPANDPEMLCVSPEHFSQHLEVLKRAYQPISLSQLTRTVREAQVPDRGIAVTFDDGYADNLYYAKPILEQYDVSATIFVVSGWVNSSHEFFWDDLARILLETPELPAQLELEIGGKQRLWSFVEGSQSDHFATTNETLWNVQMTDAPTPRQRAYLDLTAIVRDQYPEQRNALMSQIACWAGVSQNGRQDHYALSIDELHRLDQGDLIEIGAHTVSHVRLSQMAPADQYAEIAQSKNQLEEMLEHPIQSFSYPFGSLNDYGRASIQAVREAGFASACSNFEDHVHRWTNLYEIPRFVVRNWDGEEFERQLSMWW